MRQWLPLLLAFVALFGLLGQEAALAQAMPATQTSERAAASDMPSDCAGMMEGAKKAQPDAPCTGMTFDCIAKMGCTTTVALLPDRVLEAPLPFRGVAPEQRPAAALNGRTFGPEPDPPTVLG
jgi:hypothetical protein